MRFLMEFFSKKLLTESRSSYIIAHVDARTVRVVIGAWLSLVERPVRDREVAGSNPVAPIFLFVSAGSTIFDATSFVPIAQLDRATAF